jgi:NAD(P)-dependent dehydrogenase (short-subunit alcohol dehydrogenase family)
MSYSIKQIIKFLFDRRPVINLKCNIITLQPSNLLENRCAIITGGTSGIGLAIAKAYIKAGATVIITGRDKDKLNTISKSIQRELNTSNIYPFLLDNMNVQSFENAFENLLAFTKSKGLPSIDILVNNAGVNCQGMPNAVEVEYDKVMNTNLKGTFFLSQLFGKYLIKNNIKGNILNISSASSLRPADSAYTLSKWGIRGLTLGLAKSLSQYGITVNSIAPGPTATPMMLNSLPNNYYLKRIPLGRYIMPEEIANMSVFLVSEMGRSIIGDTIYMTGGAGNITLDDVKYSF